MTRPRRWSGTASWMVVFAVTAIEIPPAPATAIATSEIGTLVDTASTTQARPSAMAPIAIGRVPGRRWNATHRAARVGPTPDAAIRNPNPDAPTSRTLP